MRGLLKEVQEDDGVLIINGHEYVRKRKEKAPIPAVICYKCGSGRTEVADTRTLANGSKHRRRVCSICGARWSTIEVGYIQEEIK